MRFIKDGASICVLIIAGAIIFLAIILWLSGCGPQLTGCALKAEVDFHSGSKDEIKRIQIVNIPGRGLHAQVEIYDPKRLTWYPVSRDWHYKDAEILYTYYSWKQAEESGFFKKK